MVEKITADIVSQTFNLAAIRPDVEAGYAFFVGVPPRQGGKEAYDAWATTTARQQGSEYLEIPTQLEGLQGEAVLFKDEALAQEFCKDNAENPIFGDRLNVVSVSVSPEAGAVVAAPLAWKEDKMAAIARMMRK